MTRKSTHKQAPAKAVAECPLLPVIKRMNELIHAADAADGMPHHSSMINDQIETLRDYSTTVRAASFEGALFQLCMISDRTTDLTGQSGVNLESTERTLPWLIHSIANFLYGFAPDAAREPAISIHIAPELDPMAMVKNYCSMKSAEETANS